MAREGQARALTLALREAQAAAAAEPEQTLFAFDVEDGVYCYRCGEPLAPGKPCEACRLEEAGKHITLSLQDGTEGWCDLLRSIFADGTCSCGDPASEHDAGGCARCGCRAYDEDHFTVYHTPLQGAAS